MTPPAETTAVCPACAARIPLDDFVSEGFLRSRSAGDGGPYYELECPGEACDVVHVLEREPDGRRVVTRRAPRARFGFSSVGPRQVFRPERQGRTAGRRRQAGASESKRDHRKESTGRDRAHGARGRSEDDRSQRSGGRDRDRRPPRPSALDDATCSALLGVELGANRDEILAAFRERSKRMHPDLFASFDEDFQRLAHEKFIQLQQARDRLLARTRGS